MKYLNSDGLRTVLSKIKDKFATKQELQDVEKKVGGGYEEVNIRLNTVNVNGYGNAEYKYFKLIKIGRRVDVFQVKELVIFTNYLPLNFRTNLATFIGYCYRKTNNKKYFFDKSCLIVKDSVYVYNYENGNYENVDLAAVSQNNIDQLYIGSYITKE